MIINLSFWAITIFMHSPNKAKTMQEASTDMQNSRICKYFIIKNNSSIPHLGSTSKMSLTFYVEWTIWVVRHATGKRGLALAKERPSHIKTWHASNFSGLTSEEPGTLSAVAALKQSFTKLPFKQQFPRDNRSSLFAVIPLAFVLLPYFLGKQSKTLLVFFPSITIVECPNNLFYRTC